MLSSHSRKAPYKQSQWRNSVWAGTVRCPSSPSIGRDDKYFSARMVAFVPRLAPPDLLDSLPEVRFEQRQSAGSTVNSDAQPGIWNCYTLKRGDFNRYPPVHLQLLKSTSSGYCITLHHVRRSGLLHWILARPTSRSAVFNALSSHRFSISRRATTRSYYNTRVLLSVWRNV